MSIFDSVKSNFEKVYSTPYENVKKYNPYNVVKKNIDNPTAFLDRNAGRIGEGIGEGVEQVGALFSDVPEQKSYVPDSRESVLGVDVSAGYPDYGSMSGGATGGGTGGGGSVNSLASQRQALIEQNLRNLIAGIDQGYNDTQSDLTRSEELIKSSTSKGKESIQDQLTAAQSALENRRRVGERIARRNYADQISETRRRARAMGGAQGSGFLELASRLDQQLAQNMQDIGNNVAGLESQAQLTAQQAMNELEGKLQQTIAQIESERRMSLRQKEQAKREAQSAAAQQALDVQQWVAERASRGSSVSVAQQNAMRQQGLTQQYSSEIARIMQSDLPENQKQALVNQTTQNFIPGMAGTGAMDFGDIQAYYAPREPEDPYKIFGVAKDLYDMGREEDAERLMGMTPFLNQY